MSDVRAAAERLRRTLTERLKYPHLGCEEYRQMLSVIDHYQPPDDEEPITEDWLLSVGFERLTMDMYSLSSAYVWWLAPVKGGFAFVDSGGSYLCCLKSRGDVRRLCSALGITLKGE